MSWLRRNTIALIAVAVLLPATVGFTFWNDWAGYWGNRPSLPTVVDSGAEARYADALWRVLDTRSAESSSEFGRTIGLPDGTRFISVLLDVAPGETPLSCQFSLVEEGGSQRTWSTAELSPIDYFPEDGFSTFCDPEISEPYQLDVYFVVPDDASDELVLTVESGQALPAYLRLRL